MFRANRIGPERLITLGYGREADRLDAVRSFEAIGERAGNSFEYPKSHPAIPHEDAH